MRTPCCSSSGKSKSNAPVALIYNIAAWMCDDFGLLRRGAQTHRTTTVAAGERATWAEETDY